MRQKAIKCTVELKVQAITCPGVILPSQEDIYLSVRIMGQYQKSKCVPPVFPLLLHKQMVFVKTFVGMLDPAAVAEHLENDTTSLELIQLVPPEGEILATFEADTREFLYPSPRLTPRSPGPEREILMKRSISFPGISPRVVFSTTSIIEECDVKHGQPAVSSHGRSSAEPTPVRTCLSSAKKKKADKVSSCGYEKSTVASRSRAPSPYTHRKMCQLSEEARQRLSHLKLGPYTFQKETAPQAPFVVPRSPNTSLMESPTHLTSQSFTKRSPLHMRSRSYTTELTDASLLGSFRSKPSQEASMQAARSFPNKSPIDKSTPASRILLDQSPVLTRCSLRERFQSSSSPSQSQEIHKRVQRILNRHGPRCKLSFVRHVLRSQPHVMLSICVQRHSPKHSLRRMSAFQTSSIDSVRRSVFFTSIVSRCAATVFQDKESEEEEKGVRQSSCVSAHCDSVIDSRLQQDSRSISGEPSAHLDSRTFWTSRATVHTETSHRAAFEDSLSNIYKELYTNASRNIWTQ